MRSKLIRRARLVASSAVAVAFALSLAIAPQATSAVAHATGYGGFCADWPALCVDNVAPGSYYIGHDEPSALFYSNEAGSGNNQVYRLTLPEDPPTMPNQAGTAGTWNFQLHPAFWFGMAMCDTQSDPNYTHTCAPDSDSNIFNSPNPNSPRYIGKHPGSAFMEMQFYPPGWSFFPFAGGISCAAHQWCAALNIDSLGDNANTGQLNNNACLSTVGLETVNFAFITKSGVAQAPANPVQATTATYTPDPTKDLFMNSGDSLSVSMHDTAAGFQVVIKDGTTGQTGSMTASIANRFGQVDFDPKGTTCENLPYAFHPLYSTSSPNTRVTWTAHSYNVAFSDEIGHFEYCSKVNTTKGTCTAASASDPSGADADDVNCFPPSASLLVKIGGCASDSVLDSDFDGVSYQKVWPGTLPQAQDERIHPSALLFTSPLFNGNQNYSRVAFETDMPRIERPACNGTTGAGCVNPPPGANFYPIYTTRMVGGVCRWQLGGTMIPGTLNTFGGNSRTEYGTHVLFLFYPNVGFKPIYLAEDYRHILSSNPCV